MKTLKVGDIRQKGDEVRQKSWTYKASYGQQVWGNDYWKPVQLIGWPILPSDLFNAEFRRPNGRS